MDISQAKEEKSKAERAIKKLLLEFVKKTGLQVNSCDLELLNTGTHENPNKTTCVAVALDIRLGG